MTTNYANMTEKELKTIAEERVIVLENIDWSFEYTFNLIWNELDDPAENMAEFFDEEPAEGMDKEYWWKRFDGNYNLLLDFVRAMQSSKYGHMNYTNPEAIYLNCELSGYWDAEMLERLKNAYGLEEDYEDPQDMLSVVALMIIGEQQQNGTRE